MKKVLAITATIVPFEKSVSKKLLDVFVAEYRKNNPQDEIININLNTLEMAQKTMNNLNMPNYFNDIDSERFIEQLRQVDKVIMSVPMTNFNVSATAKNYLDHISVADKTFSYKYATSSKDAKGLLDHLKVQILTTQGAPFGWYPWGNHTKYLLGHWAFLGATVSDAILIAGTKTSPYKTMSPSQVVALYDEKIKQAAATF